MPIKHTFTSSIPDEGTPGGRVQPSHWNASHDLSTFAISDVPGLTAALAGKAPVKTGYYKSNMLLVPGDNIGSYSTAAAPANATRGYKMRIIEPTTVALWVYRSSAGTAGAAKAGLYSIKDAASPIPDALITDLGTVTIGAGAGAYQGPSTAIPAGEYYLVVFFDGSAPTLRTATTQPGTFNSPVMEQEMIAGAQNPVIRADNTITYPGSLPNPITTSGWSLVTTNALITAFLKVI